MVSRDETRVNGQHTPPEAIRKIEDAIRLMEEWATRYHIVGGDAGQGSMGVIPAGYKVVPTIIPVDFAEPNIIYATGRVEKDSEGKSDRAQKVWSLSWILIRRIAEAAGIRWLSGQCGRVDDGSDPDVVEYVATCLHTKIDGLTVTYRGEYSLDFTERFNAEVQKQAQWAGTDKKRPRDTTPEQWAETKARASLATMRVHKVARAASGAKRRAVLDAINLRASGYSLDELRKPFLVLRLSPDLADESARNALMLVQSGLADVFAGSRNTPDIRALLGGRPRTQDAEAPALPAHEERRALAPPREDARQTPQDARRTRRSEPEPPDYPDDDPGCWEDAQTFSEPTPQAPAAAGSPPPQDDGRPDDAIPEPEEFEALADEAQCRWLVRVCGLVGEQPRVPPDRMSRPGRGKFYAGAFARWKKGGR